MTHRIPALEKLVREDPSDPFGRYALAVALEALKEGSLQTTAE